MSTRTCKNPACSDRAWWAGFCRLCFQTTGAADQHAAERAAEEHTRRAAREQAELDRVRDRLQRMAADSKTSAARRLGYALWMTADATGKDAFESAAASADRLGDLLAAVPMVKDEAVRGGLYPLIRPLLFDAPPATDSSQSPSGGGQPGLNVDYFLPHAPDVALATLEKRQPTASGLAGVRSCVVGYDRVCEVERPAVGNASG